MAKFSLNSEPVRTLAYPVLLALVGYLVTKGFVDGETGDIIIGALAGLVGAGGIEGARNRVTPV